VVSGDFEWDDARAFANEAKHGVSFDEAAFALATDPNEVAFEDPAEPAHVHSLVLSRTSRGARELLVITTERGVRTRIVPARKATPHEERIYQEGP
jgi:uncharacterized protein